MRVIEAHRAKVVPDCIRGGASWARRSVTEAKDAGRILLCRGWLSHAPTAFQREVLSRSMLRTFEPDQPIYHCGDPPGGMYGLVSGAAAVLVAPGTSGPYFVHFAHPGSWFGSVAAITREPRRVGVVARRRTTAMHLSMAAIDEMVAADHSVWRYFALNVVLNLDLAMQAYDDLMIRDPETRVAAILLRLAGHEAGVYDCIDTLRIDVTQTEVAEIANLSRNAIGRILSRLAAAGLIAVGYGHLTILELEALIARARKQ